MFHNEQEVAQHSWRIACRHAPPATVCVGIGRAPNKERFSGLD